MRDGLSAARRSWAVAWRLRRPMPRYEPLRQPLRSGKTCCGVGTTARRETMTGASGLDREGTPGSRRGARIVPVAAAARKARCRRTVGGSGDRAGAVAMAAWLPASSMPAWRHQAV